MVPNSPMLNKMTVFWNRVLRWVTNCFLSTPVSILPCEACLSPLDSLLPHKHRMAAFCMPCSSPFINLAAARLPPSFPSHSDKRARDSRGHLLRGLRQNYIPLRWDQHRLVPAVCSHLPIDAVCYTLRPMVAVAKTLPLLHPHILPIGTCNDPTIRLLQRTRLKPIWCTQRKPE